MFFDVLKAVNHVRAGTAMQRRIGASRKRTIYAPRAATSLLLLPLAAWACSFMGHIGFSWQEVIAGIGIGIAVGFAACFILVPFAFSIKLKSARFAYTESDTSYFRPYFFE